MELGWLARQISEFVCLYLSTSGIISTRSKPAIYYVDAENWNQDLVLAQQDLHQLSSWAIFPAFPLKTNTQKRYLCYHIY